MLQTCTKCHVEKSLEAFELRSDTGKRRGTCKDCRNARLSELYPQRAEKIKASGKRWREANRDKHLAHAREYAAANKERMNAVSLKWARENKEVAKARSIAWREANRERVREAERLRREADPEKFRSSVRNRRAKLKVSGQHSADDITALFQNQAGLCNACKCDLQETGYHVDHVKAVANGGSNGPENLQLLCPTCNVSKGTKDMHEWAKSKGYA